MRSRTLSLFLLVVALAACQKGEKDKAQPDPDPNDKPVTAKVDAGAGAGTASGKPATPSDQIDLDSKDILARDQVSTQVDVKHVLISWKDLAKAFRGGQDPRGAQRDNAAAAALAKEVLAKLQADPKAIDKLIEEHGEDPGSKGGKAYTVTPDASLVPGFKNLALRLQMDEAGIVVSPYGYHVMVRVTPPPPDPLESADILARPPNKGTATVLHILIGWKDAPAVLAGRGEARSKARTKADADKLASELLAQVRAGGDMKALMKKHSEDPGSAQTGDAYPVDANAQLVPEFKALSMRLRVGEAGLVKTDYGWHIIQRIEGPPPPPPDSLDSVDILGRDPVTDTAKVKHVLLGWTEAHASDPRGKDRSRADLEALVKKTMQRLKDGEKIEALMAELSEDGGSAKSGNSYDVTPDAGLVQPFKDLSLRLNVGEVGAVKTQFGIHIIQRVE